MAQVLRNKNSATRFQILVEIAANQPYIQQKDIARRIGVSSQAVSDYISKLEKDGWIKSDGRSRYRITKEGVNWTLKALRELQQVSAAAERALTGTTVWAAIAACAIRKGETVSLVMKNGLLYAGKDTGKGASGKAIRDAAAGEDIGVTDIEGMVALEPAHVTVAEVPDVQDDGSRGVDYEKLRKRVAGSRLVGALGIEAMVALHRVDRNPDFVYGVREAAVEAARSGLPFLVVCPASEQARLLQHLSEEGTAYGLVDVRKRKPKSKRKKITQ